MRASIVTRPALDRLRPGSIECESSKVNLTGQLPTLARMTAKGAPGESTDLATMNSVAPLAAFALKAAARETSPLTEAPNLWPASELAAEPALFGSVAASFVSRCKLAATMFASAEFAGRTACNLCHAPTASPNRPASSSALALSHNALGCVGSNASDFAM